MLAQVRNDLQMGRLPPVQPFHAMAYPFSADLALAISQKYAQFCAITASRMRAPQLAHPAARPLAPGERLRIAYVSSDFGNHPLSHLMGSVFGLHDRSRVQNPPLHPSGNPCMHARIILRPSGVGFNEATHQACC